MVGEEQIERWVAAGLISAEQGEKLRATLPRASLRASFDAGGMVFLCAALNGAVILLFSLLYGIAVPAHVLLLLWLLCIAPLVYVVRRTAVSVLVVLMFLGWIALFVQASAGLLETIEWLRFPLAYLAGGVFLFALGGAHYLHAGLFGKVGRVYRLAGIQVALLALFALGIGAFSSHADLIDWRSHPSSNRFLAGQLPLCALAGMLTVFDMTLVRRRTQEITAVEGPISIALCALAVVCAFVPLPVFLHLVVWNAVLLALLGAVVAVAWARADVRLVEIGAVALVAVGVSRWVDLAWGRVGTGALVGGAAVIAVAAAGAGWWARGKAKRKREESGTGAGTKDPVSVAVAAPTPAPPADQELAALLKEVRDKTAQIPKPAEQTPSSS